MKTNMTPTKATRTPKAAAKPRGHHKPADGKYTYRTFTEAQSDMLQAGMEWSAEDGWSFSKMPANVTELLHSDDIRIKRAAEAVVWLESLNEVRKKTGKRGITQNRDDINGEMGVYLSVHMRGEDNEVSGAIINHAADTKTRASLQAAGVHHVNSRALRVADDRIEAIQEFEDRKLTAEEIAEIDGHVRDEFGWKLDKKTKEIVRDEDGLPVVDPKRVKPNPEFRRMMVSATKQIQADGQTPEFLENLAHLHGYSSGAAGDAHTEVGQLMNKYDMKQLKLNDIRKAGWDAVAEDNGLPAVHVGVSKADADTHRAVIAENGIADLMEAAEFGATHGEVASLFAPFGDISKFEREDLLNFWKTRDIDVVQNMWESALTASISTGRRKAVTV